MLTPYKPVKVKTVVLFFIAGMVPSREETEIANRIRDLKTRVSFRNASQVNPGESLEKADYVMGDVPDCYKGFARFGDDQPENSIAEVQPPTFNEALSALQAAEISATEPAEIPSPIVASQETAPVIAPVAPVASEPVVKSKPAKETKAGKRKR